MFNPMEMMGKLKEMQAEMEKAKSMLDDITVTAEAGGGLVKVTANANRKVLKIDIDPTLMVPADKEMVEDLVTAAVNIALEKADETAREEISKVTANYAPKIPGFDLGNFTGK